MVSGIGISVTVKDLTEPLVEAVSPKAVDQEVDMVPVEELVALESGLEAK